MYKILNNAELYLYEELFKIKISYAEEFLVMICDKNHNKILKKSMSFGDLCDKLFIEHYSLHNTPFTNNTMNNSGNTKNSGGTNNSDSNNSGGTNNSDTNNSSPESKSPIGNYSPGRNNSPISTRLYNNKFKKSNSSSSLDKKILKYNSLDLDSPILKKSPNNISTPISPHLNSKKKLTYHSVSLQELNDDIFKYKYLYYTDNSYTIPNHICKLLDVLYNIKCTNNNELSLPL